MESVSFVAGPVLRGLNGKVLHGRQCLGIEKLELELGVSKRNRSRLKEERTVYLPRGRAELNSPRFGELTVLLFKKLW